MRIIKIGIVTILTFLISVTLGYAKKNYHELSNKYISVRVYKDSGRFSIKTVKGSSDEKGDDNKQILYDDNSPTSFTTIALDDGDDVYKYGSSDGWFIRKPEVYGNSIISKWKVDDCEITQIISLTSGDKKIIKNSVKIYYEAKNIYRKSQKIGIRIVLDTLLGDSDSIPYMIPGNSKIDDETEFKDKEVPIFWYSFDQLKKPKIRSIGTLDAPDLVMPDRILFTNWKRLDNNIWKFKYDSGRSFKRSLLGRRDSAVALYYNIKDIEPGKSYIASTKYGVYSVKKNHGRMWSTVFGGEREVDLGQIFPVTLEVKNISKIDLKNCLIELEVPSFLKVATSLGEVYSPLIKRVSSFDAGDKVNLRWAFASVGSSVGTHSLVLKATGEANGLFYSVWVNHDIVLMKPSQRLVVKTVAVDPFDIPHPSFFVNNGTKKAKTQKVESIKQVIEPLVRRAVVFKRIIRFAPTIKTNIFLNPKKKFVYAGVIIFKLPISSPKKIEPYYLDKADQKRKKLLLINKIKRAGSVKNNLKKE